MKKDNLFYSQKYSWFNDYIRSTDDDRMIWRHFIKDFIFQHRLRFMFFFRLSTYSKNPLTRFFCKYQIFRFSRKFGIEIKSGTKIGTGFVMTHPYNITINPNAVIGKNVNIMKGATIGASGGKHPGVPIIGDCVFIGINSTILGGITIGDDVMIAPNTFVNLDIPSHSIAVGNPCKVIKRDNATKEYIYYRV